MIRCCTDCGAQFEAKGAWMKRCWPCWREAKDRDARDDAYGRGWNAGFAAAGRRPTPPPALDDGLLRSLIVLCHPDRHPPERFEAANTATATLLSLLNGRSAGSSS